MTALTTTLTLAGPAAFGAVVGWITYRTLRRNSAPVDLKDLASVVGVVGGGVVTALFGKPEVFGSYSLGLAAGFFAYFVVGRRVDKARLAAIQAEEARLEAKAKAAGSPATPAASPAGAPATSPTLDELRKGDWMLGRKPPPAEDDDER